MINILIVEDERLIGTYIKLTLEKHGYQVIDILDNFEDTVEYLNKFDVDLVLLDITINGSKNGIDIANHLNNNRKTPFIFISSHFDEETLNEAVSMNPSGYIVKPFLEIDIYATVKVVSNQILQSTHKNNVISLEDGNKVYRVKQDDILYIKSEGNYVKVYCNDQALMIRQTLKHIKTLLDPSYFVQIHKSYLANISHIKSFSNLQVVVQNQKLPVGRAYKLNLIQNL